MAEITGIIVVLIVGLVAGGAGGWLVQSFRAKSRLATQTAEHQAAIAGLQAEHDKATSDAQTAHLQETAALNAQIAGLNGQLEQAATATQLLESAKAQFREAAKLTAAEALQNNNQQFLDLAKQNLDSSMETAQRELDQRHQKFQELVKPLSDQYSQLTETFQNSATTALQNNSKQFLELAQENWGKTLETARSEFNLRHQQFQELVKPLSEGYTQLNPQIATLTTQVGAITSETAKLASALKGDNRAVGNWGELQLHRVVELAGMTDYCDFAEQQTTGSSQDRPDLVIKLPEQRSIVVDAKASTAAYLEISQAPDEETAQAAYSRHAAALRRQVDSLAGKNYGAKEANSLDFVVMFIPGDQFLSAALNANPELINYAMSRRIAIATPASLIAMLWAIASGWQQFRLAEDASKVKEAGEEMHKRMLTFIGHYQNVGRRLDSAVDAYNRSIGSFDRSVVPQGRRFAGLVVGDDDDFPALDTLDETARTSAYATDPTENIAAQAA